jgi:hypothetical protein
MRIGLAAAMVMFAAACEIVPVPLPTATATFQNVRLDLPRGSYCWSSGGKATCADSASADLLLEHGYLKPYPTTGGFEVQVAFQSKSELRSFHVQRVKSPIGTSEETTTLARTFHLPEVPGVPAGIYIYMIRSTWPQGDVSFFLPIELASGVV